MNYAKGARKGRANHGPAFTVLVVVVVLIVALLIGGGFWAVSFFKSAFEPPLSVGCTATVNGMSHQLAVDQSQNAALIAGISRQRIMPPRAATIALATAMQESRLRNIDYGDLDSVGLFQQRPSQDWGTVEQIMDPVYSTNAFYAGLEKVPGYTNMAVTDAAQAVQKSAFPLAYAQHEALAKAFATALTGQSPATLSCTLPAVAADAPASDIESLKASLETSLGAMNYGAVSTPDDSKSIALQIQASDDLGWATAQWAVTYANQFGMTAVSFDGKEWKRDSIEDGLSTGWADAKTNAGVVTLTLTGTAKP